MKYDIALVRNIDKNIIKRDLLRTLLPFAHRMKAQIIAEGIETKEEYRAIKEMGIPLGQGFFFATPGAPFPRVKAPADNG